MDFAAVLNEHFVLGVVVGCLVVGYVLKNASFCTKIPNNDIPVILAVVGALSNIVVSGLSFDSIVYGALMGLASTGLHQAFKRFIEREHV